MFKLTLREGKSGVGAGGFGGACGGVAGGEGVIGFGLVSGAEAAGGLAVRVGRVGSSCDKEVFFLFGNKVMVYKIVGAADFCDFFARLFCHAPHFKGLDDGLARLGAGVVKLVLAAVDLEIKAGRVDQALARLDRAASAAARQESWVLRRGDVLAQAGRATAAKQAYEHVLELIAALPPRQRRTRATTAMEERARQALAILAAPGLGR